MAELTLERLKKIHDDELSKYVPNPESMVMRYMEFAKFVSMLETKTLYLTRGDNFEDPLEGFLFDWYIQRMIVVPNILGEDRAEKWRKEFIDEAAELKTKTFISCWNEASNESYALWQIYAKKYGIAIKTQVKKLEELIKGYPAKVYKIRYIDKEETVIFPNINDKLFSFDNLFVCKQNHYSYEKEIRIILVSEEKEIKPIPINDLVGFIEEIYVSPFAEDWFLNLVRDLVNKTYKLEIPVNKSQIKIIKD
jgi:hypothetical protein